MALPRCEATPTPRCSGSPPASSSKPRRQRSMTTLGTPSIGRGIGDSDDDGKWEVFATVNGTKGSMLARKQVEGDIKTTGGEKVGTYSGEYPEPVDAPIITIIAAHCGPLAVAVPYEGSSSA